ncbi:polyphenol oxidase family protein [Aliikangiella maris]|uniref:Laccase domain-containing protein n=2 Tax=Aliikangiella maris TaxID=3162458 RepID=A0ABV3MKG5_9GAMM
MMKNNGQSLIFPQWPAPANVRAVVTTRMGGVSIGRYASLNVATHVDDNPQSVAQNRQQLLDNLPTQSGLKYTIAWLNQVHGNQCIEVSQSTPQNQTADAAFTTKKNIICNVMTADCLPVLFANRQGSWVAACHAGWRGLLAGVIENTVNQYINVEQHIKQKDSINTQFVKDQSSTINIASNIASNNKPQLQSSTNDLIAFIGPAISQRHFEVGSEVFTQFVSKNKQYTSFFRPAHNQFSAQKYDFDFVGLARFIMQQMGIEVFGGEWCSFNDEQRFYSYRRDGQTGRMASLIWIE